MADYPYYRSSDGYAHQGGYGQQPPQGYGQAQPSSYGQPQQPQAYGSQPPAASHHPPAAEPESRAFRWWIPAEGIRRDVIQADIQRYLGQDALVKPGNGTGEHARTPGYWIAGYRNLTSAMVMDLKTDSTNFDRLGARGSYSDSQIHQSRQHWGPTAPVAHVEQPAVPAVPILQPTYPGQSAHGQGYQQTQASQPALHAGYATAPAGYNSYQQPPQTSQTAYSGVQAPSPATSHYSSSSSGTQGTAQHYTHSSGYGADSRGSNPNTPYQSGQDSRVPRDPRYAAPAPSVQSRVPAGHYLASDGNYYPLAQRPS